MLSKIISFLFFALMFTACNDIDVSTSKLIGFDSLHKDVYLSTATNTTKRIQIIDNEDDYKDELLKYSNRNIKENLDFSEGNVLLVDFGERPTGAYSIDIKSIIERDEYLEVSISLAVPGDKCVTIQVITNPYEFIYIPSKKTIIIKEEYTKGQTCN